jgi:DivIVA domain-containing protein
LSRKQFELPSAHPVEGLRIQPEEIANRQFPRARRGLDPEAVRDWLRIVARAYEIVAEDYHRALEERNRMHRSLERATEAPPSATLRSALIRLKVRRGFRGYSTEAVQEIITAATAELAKLETRVAVLSAENRELRALRIDETLDQAVEGLEQQLFSAGSNDDFNATGQAKNSA